MSTNFASFQQQINELNETKRLIEEAEKQLNEKDTIIEDLEKEMEWLAELAQESGVTLKESVRVKLSESGTHTDAMKRYRKKFSNEEGGKGRRVRSVKVYLNGKWVKADTAINKLAPASKGPLPQKKEKNAIFASVITGELDSQIKDAVAIAAMSELKLMVEVGVGGQLQWTFMVEEPGLDIRFRLQKRYKGKGSRAGEWDPWVEMPWHGMLQPEKPGDQPKYQSQKEVEGLWGTALEPCQICFIWDNSYSLLTRKTVSFEIKVYSDKAYQAKFEEEVKQQRRQAALKEADADDPMEDEIARQYQRDLDAASGTSPYIGNLVSAQLTLQGLTAVTFSSSKQRKVLSGLAAVIGLDPSTVSITEVQDSGTQKDSGGVPSITIGFQIHAPTKKAASEVEQILECPTFASKFADHLRRSSPRRSKAAKAKRSTRSAAAAGTGGSGEKQAEVEKEKEPQPESSDSIDA